MKNGVLKNVHYTPPKKTILWYPVNIQRRVTETYHILLFVKDIQHQHCHGDEQHPAV